MLTAPRRRPRRTAAPAKQNLHDPALYVNRELSMLAFQRRVLEEAQDEGNPLLERIKFLSIVGSNLNEFFMVRVAGLFSQLESGVLETGPDGMTPAQQLEAIRLEYEQLLLDCHDCLKKVLAELEQQGIRVVDYARLTVEERAAARQYFEDTIYPVLTPLAFDPGRPFPHISNLSLNLSVLIRDPEGNERFARIKVPDKLPQLIPLRKNLLGRAGPLTLVWIEQVIEAHLDALFPGMRILESHPFHVTRDAEMEIQELESADLLEEVEEGVRQRRFGAVVRLMVHTGMPDSILDILKTNLEIDNTEVFHVNGPLALNRLRDLAALDRPELKDPPFTPRTPRQLQGDDDIFTAIRRNDILLHHPFDSFQPVVDFLRTAARDPQVLAIKMTLYRVGPKSPVVQALLDANRSGKQVAVLVELKARFDEESNIEWARALEGEGVHVVYGLIGLKVHAKVALVVRQEGGAVRRYLHLGTGNYNAVTAQIYTDLGLLTCDDEMGADATDLFNYLTGYSAKNDYRKLLVAPVNLRRSLESLIQREIDHARAGREARLILKTNALVDGRIIRLLYQASQAGVQVDLLVRGICCLRPGIPGLSDRIHVVSIVGRFLEHTRMYYFRNSGEDEIYLGSADLMPRNINRRVETLFPLRRAAMVKYLRDRVLATYLKDNLKARIMNAAGEYPRAERNGRENAVNAQAALLARRNP
ncbi:MAG: polyphosphate kinase 1 [Bryobacteraceae bacterium]|nr:polyphosphate kinase 1 [Bryobacteraceae bacterium]